MHHIARVPSQHSLPAQSRYRVSGPSRREWHMLACRQIQAKRVSACSVITDQQRRNDRAGGGGGCTPNVAQRQTAAVPQWSRSVERRHDIFNQCLIHRSRVRIPRPKAQWRSASSGGLCTHCLELDTDDDDSEQGI
jgi:hypothetical protein